MTSQADRARSKRRSATSRAGGGLPGAGSRTARGRAGDPAATGTVPEPITIEGLIVELRRRGQRSTTARRAVLEALLAAGDAHLTAEELAARVSSLHPSVHLSTIYRTLDALDEAGLISRARIGDQPASYHLTDDVHHHAVCSACGSVLNLSPALFDELSARLLADCGFHADPRHLTISGTCRDCTDR